MNSASSPPRTPVQIARALYGEAFVGTDRETIQASMKDFEKLTPHDRLFIQCHLQYLTLCAQERTQQLLVGIREILHHLTGAVYTITDEVTRPALEREWVESQQSAGTAGIPEQLEPGLLSEFKRLGLPDPLPLIVPDGSAAPAREEQAALSVGSGAPAPTASPAAPSRRPRSGRKDAENRALGGQPQPETIDGREGVDHESR